MNYAAASAAGAAVDPFSSPRSPSVARAPSASARRQWLRLQDLLDGGEKLILCEGLRKNRIISIPGIAGQKRAAHGHRLHKGAHAANRNDEIVPVNFGHHHVSQ